MKGKIGRKGALFIGRPGNEEFSTQYCPYNADDAACGDWCPLFMEPKEKHTGQTELKICKATWYFDEFTDERGA